MRKGQKLTRGWAAMAKLCYLTELRELHNSKTAKVALDMNSDEKMTNGMNFQNSGKFSMSDSTLPI